MASFYIEIIGWKELEPSLMKDQICQKMKSLTLDFDVFSLLDIIKGKKRSYGKRKNGNFKRKHKTVLTLFDLNILLILDVIKFILN